VCHFLQARVWYKTQPAMRLDPARFGIAVESDKLYWSEYDDPMQTQDAPKLENLYTPFKIKFHRLSISSNLLSVNGKFVCI